MVRVVGEGKNALRIALRKQLEAVLALLGADGWYVRDSKEPVSCHSSITFILNRDVGLMLCSPAKMKQYNAEYRGINKTTDLLSFPAQEVS